MTEEQLMEKNLEGSGSWPSVCSIPHNPEGTDQARVPVEMQTGPASSEPHDYNKLSYATEIHP
jgi:hypothetical protein